MKISITNFRGISEAEFEIDKITYIGGMNWQGKTSIAQAVGGVLANVLNIYDELKKKDIKGLIHEGNKAAVIKISDEKGKIVAKYPKMEVTTEGKPPFCDKISAGLVSFCDLKPKEKIDYIQTWWDVLPTLGDIESALPDSDKDLASELFQNIEQKGWDAMNKNFREHGASLKGQWEYITKERFGIEKAETWYPEDYVQVNDPAKLEIKIKELSKKYEDALKNSLSKQEIEKLQEMADREPRIKELISKIESKGKSLRKNLDSIVVDATTYKCPHCNGLIILAEDNKKNVLLQKFSNSVTDNINKELNRLRDNRQIALNDLEKCTEAAKKLSEITPADEEEINEIKDEHEKTKRILEVYNKIGEARKITERIKKNQNMINVTNLDGLRKEVLQRFMDEFNENISSYANNIFTDIKSIVPVKVDNDFDIYLYGMPYLLCSDSQKWILNAIFRMVFANKNKCLLVLDKYDILDNDNKGNIFELILKNNMQTLICATIEKDKMPNVNAINGCHSYFVEKGKLKGV
uniref:Putative ATPase domain containing protein n=1 Tax=viral metagenome TaxID=1070528 RepID=A0A6M3LE28_9ZZZZ